MHRPRKAVAQDAGMGGMPAGQTGMSDAGTATGTTTDTPKKKKAKKKRSGASTGTAADAGMPK